MSNQGAGDNSGHSEWQDWVGREETVVESISPQRVATLAATLDCERIPTAGEALPPGWHWVFFNPFVPRHGLGEDGHPKRGGFLPPVPLPRRMWAAGRIDYGSERLIVGEEAIRRTTIRAIETKSGRSGQLVFVSLLHRISCGGVECLSEEQDIVYREASSGATAQTPAPEGAQWSKQVEPDPVLLFRYSALTSNGHRIHYDQQYARNEEGYPDLVVQGPLSATLLQNFAGELRPDARLTHFGFRGVHPLFVNAPFALEAKTLDGDPNALDMWARGPNGELAMRASARFA